MVDSIAEMANKIIDFGDYDESELTQPKAFICVEKAKEHLNLETKLPPEDRNWYENKYQEEALFWTAMLFSKLKAGHLDSKAISVGAIEEDTLMANESGEVTQWYHNYRRERNRLRARFANPDYQRRSSRTTIGGGREYRESEYQRRNTN